MLSQKTKVSVLLSGEQGFIYENLVYQLQEAPELRLITTAMSQEPVPEFVVYVFDDLESQGLGECSLTPEEKGAAIAQYQDAGSRVIVLINRESDVSMVSSPNIVLCRIPQVFGKWSTPAPANPVGYLCSLVIDGKEATYDQQADLDLLYVDDLAKTVIDGIVSGDLSRCGRAVSYRITGRELNTILVQFRESRNTLVIPPVGSGLVRALYSTYISYLDKEDFSYPWSIMQIIRKFYRNAENRVPWADILPDGWSWYYSWPALSSYQNRKISCRPGRSALLFPQSAER